MSKPIKKAAAARKKNGYVMPKKLPVGSILQDSSKIQWKSGPSIGIGGFGEIYCACRADSKVKNAKDYPYVIKIEPHGNGPLFVEMHFYMRNAKNEDIEEFKQTHKLKHLGMPNFIGSGSHDLEGLKHRFIVMPRYGSDIWSYYLSHNKKFPLATVYRLALQMIDVLEYIHSRSYVHGDIKGANILLGFGKNGDAQAFLVDFGLASHYTMSPEYKPDPKKMHNGTIEYTSRDAHNGVPTMRGDFEILGYNLIHWAGAQLPWEHIENDPTKVQAQKNKAMSDVKGFMKTCFKNDDVPQPLLSFLKHVANLNFNSKPDYDKCRKLFAAGVVALGEKDTGPLIFATGAATKNKVPAKGQKRASAVVISDEEKHSDKSDEEIEEIPAKKARQSKKKPSPTTSKTVLLETPSKKDAKKVYHFNIDLDVSVSIFLIFHLHFLIYFYSNSIGRCRCSC